jgi:hypothetical protein
MRDAEEAEAFGTEKEVVNFGRRIWEGFESEVEEAVD